MRYPRGIVGMWRATILVVLFAATANADLRSEEREFGEHAYKSMRAIHEQTCSCVKDGNCKLKVSRADLRAELKRYEDGLETMLPHLWPELTKKFASMTTAEARAYGERLGQAYLDTLPREDVLLWARMLSSCWSASPDVTASSPGADTSEKSRKQDTPHDGSLDKSGGVTDLKNGKMDEPGAVAEFFESCRKSAKDSPVADAYCGCLGDYLRVSPPSTIEILRQAGDSGDATKVRQLIGFRRCSEWSLDGAHGVNPFLRKGMKSTFDVASGFARCRTNMTKGRDPSTGMEFCNRLVATTP